MQAVGLEMVDQLAPGAHAAEPDHLLRRARRRSAIGTSSGITVPNRLSWSTSVVLELGGICARGLHGDRFELGDGERGAEGEGGARGGGGGTS